MYIVWQQINKNDWRLNAKNADKAKALKAFSGCVKSVGVNKCRFTEEIKPILDIKASVVEEEVEESGKPTSIMKFVGDGTELPNGDWIRVTPDFDPELRDFPTGTPLEYDGGRKKWEIWGGEGLPGGKIEEIGENVALLKIVVHHYRDKTPAVPERAAVVISSDKYLSECIDAVKGTKLKRFATTGYWHICDDGSPEGELLDYITLPMPCRPRGYLLIRLVEREAAETCIAGDPVLGYFPEQIIKTKELDGSCAYGKKGRTVTTLRDGKWVLYTGPNPKGRIVEPVDENGYLTIKVYAGF